MITHGRSVVFVGPTGTGKTVYIKDKLLNGMDKERYQPLVSSAATHRYMYMHFDTVYCEIFCVGKFLRISVTRKD